MPKSFLFTHKRYDCDGDKDYLHDDESLHHLSGGSSTSGFSEDEVSLPTTSPRSAKSSVKLRGAFSKNSSKNVSCSVRRAKPSPSITTASFPSLSTGLPKKRRLPLPWKELNNNFEQQHSLPQLHIKEEPLNSSFKSLIVSTSSSSSLSPPSPPDSGYGDKKIVFPSRSLMPFYPPSSSPPGDHVPFLASPYQIKLISPPPGGTLAHSHYPISRKDGTPPHHHHQLIKMESMMTPSSPLQFIIAAAEQQEESNEAEDTKRFIEGSRSEESQQYYHHHREPTNQPIHHQEQPVNLSVKKVDLFNLTQLAEVSIAAAKREMSLRSSNVSNTSGSPVLGVANNSNSSSSATPKKPLNNENVLVTAKGKTGGDLGISEKRSTPPKKTESSKAARDPLRMTKLMKEDKKKSSNSIPSSTSSSSAPSPGSNSARHRCVECGKGFSTLSNLARHRQTHRSLSDASAVKKCPHCDKVYVSMPAFSMHLRTHNQGCKCPYCGKGFSRPWLLQGHIRTHTGEKPFKCGICSKAFADKSNLRAHTQTHSTEKPFVCSRCGKPFALKSYLCKHIESSCMKSNRPSGPSSTSGVGGGAGGSMSVTSSSTAAAINNSSSTSSPVSSTGGTSSSSSSPPPPVSLSPSSPTNRDIRKGTPTVIAGIASRTKTASVVTKPTASDAVIGPPRSSSHTGLRRASSSASLSPSLKSSLISNNSLHAPLPSSKNNSTPRLMSTPFFLPSGNKHSNSKSCYRGNAAVSTSKMRKSSELLKPSA